MTPTFVETTAQCIARISMLRVLYCAVAIAVALASPASAQDKKEPVKFELVYACMTGSPYWAKEGKLSADRGVLKDFVVDYNTGDIANYTELGDRAWKECLSKIRAQTAPAKPQ